MYLYTYRQNTCTDKTNKNGLISEDKKWQREKKIEVSSGDMDTWHLDTWTLQSENQLKYEGLSLGPAVVCTVVAEREQNRPVKPNTGREEPSRHHDQRAVSLADWGRKEGNAPGNISAYFHPLFYANLIKQETNYFKGLQFKCLDLKYSVLLVVQASGCPES